MQLLFEDQKFNCLQADTYRVWKRQMSNALDVCVY